MLWQRASNGPSPSVKVPSAPLASTTHLPNFPVPKGEECRLLDAVKTFFPRLVRALSLGIGRAALGKLDENVYIFPVYKTQPHRRQDYNLGLYAETCQ